MDPEIPPPPDSPEAGAAPPAEFYLLKPGPRPARVPRRFATGTLLLLVTLYAMMFSCLSWLCASPTVFVVLAVYLTAIGLAQMLLFGGEKPREASIWVGAPVGAILVTGVCLSASPVGTSLTEALALACFWVLGLALCIPVSYVTGCAMAGVFLVIDRVRTGVWNPDPDKPPTPAEPDERPPGAV